MLDFLDMTFYTAWCMFANEIRIYVAVTTLFFGYYMKVTGAFYWGFGCVPVLSTITKKKASGIPWPLAIVEMLVTLRFLIWGGGIFWWVLTIALHCLIDFMFESAYACYYNFLFAFVPYVKYYIMTKEILECKFMNRVKTTKKMSSVKKT